MLKLFRYLKNYKKESIIGPLFKLIEACFELAVPLVMANIIDVGIKNQDKPYIYKMGGVLVLLAFCGLACSLTAQYFAAKASLGFGTALRRDLFKHINSLSYAEIKMLATGNPHIKEKMDLDIQVQKLRLLKSSFLSEKYALEDKIIKFYPQEIARRTDVIAGLKSDMERVAEHPKPSDETFVGMTVKGAFYSEKADAGNAILEACKAMTNPEPIPLGEYRGFTMELYFEAREYKVRLKGELGYPVTLGTDTFGNITRLDNALEGLPKRLEMNEMELDNLKKQFETAKVDVERPFPQEEELAQKSARLAELNAQLDVDEKHHEPEMEETPDEESARPSVLAALNEKSDKEEPVKPFRSYSDRDGDAR
jgi:hypothetical protein